LLRPIVKWGGPALLWERIPEVVRLAFREMWTGRPGPVQVELPAPVLYASGDPATAPVLAPDAYRPQPQASERQRSCSRRRSGRSWSPGRAWTAVAPTRPCSSWAICWDAVMPTMAARSVVPADHPNAVMGYAPAGDAARREADVILVAGSRLGNLDLPVRQVLGGSRGAAPDPDRRRPR
jgi:acetolactate synthase-1/2/3 large subunit